MINKILEKWHGNFCTNFCTKKGLGLNSLKWFERKIIEMKYHEKLNNSLF